MAGTLPSARVVAVVGFTDAGEYGNASCPHCGALGRYVLHFVCDDGKTRGAMRGCFRLFRKAHGPVARLTEQAFDKAADAKSKGTRIASWWAEILDATADLAAERITRERHAEIVLAADGRRRAWLNRNGYARRGAARRRFI